MATGATAKSWTGPNGGQWNLGADWSGSLAPVAGDDALITGLGAASYLVVTGPGTSGSLTVLGNVALTGNFSLNTLSVGTTVKSGALLLQSSVLQAGSATLLDGPIELRGPGAQLKVSGSLTLGGTRANNVVDGLDCLILSGGASVQAGTVLLTGGSFEVNSIQVDAASTFEVGSAGGVAAGTLKVDAGKALTGAGFLKASAGIVNAGTITAQGGTLSLSSPVTGSGAMQIGAGATLAFGAFDQPTTLPVSFIDPYGTLEVGAYGGSLSETGLVTGFDASDTIAYTPYGGALQSVTYSSASYGTGTLTFNGASGSLGSLRIAGDFSPYIFVVTPDANGRSDINLVLRAAAATPGPGTATPDTYAWSFAGSGQWGAAANWTDTTTSSTASVAPGVNNAVTLRIASGTSFVSGAGNSAGLTVLGAGAAALNGTFSTGTLQIGSGSEGGMLGLAGGTSFHAASARIGGNGLGATGTGTWLDIAGAVSLSARLGVTGGAIGRTGDITLAAGASIAVDNISKLELGNIGTAAAGQLQIDAGRLLSGTGWLSAASGITDNGTITAQGGTLTIDSPVTGAGMMQVAAGAALALTSVGAASTAGVAFTGAGGTLRVVSHDGIVSDAGLISGFAAGDTIAVTTTASSVTARYQPTVAGYGQLVLSSGAAPLGTLNLAGDFSNYGFNVATAADGTAQITLAASTGPAARTPDNYVWSGPGMGAWTDAANWKDTTTGATPAPLPPIAINPVVITGPSTNFQVVTGAGAAASLAVHGNVTFTGVVATGSLSEDATAQLLLGTGSQMTVAHDVQLGAGLLAATGGGQVSAASLTLAGGTLRADASSTVRIGAGSGAGTGIRIESGATLTSSGGTLDGDVTDAGVLNLAAGLTNVSGTLRGGTVAFSGASTGLRIHGLLGTATVTGMQPGNTIDLAGITGASLSGNTVTAGGGTLSFGTAPAGYQYALASDGAGGTALSLSAIPPAFSISNPASGSSTASGDAYNGPVAYLQHQYIWSGTAGVAIAASVPNVFLKGGAGDDALAVSGGSNVLDGGTGSNFLMGVGTTGSAQDTFFLDARGGGSTWSTLVNFHPGDMATIFGFNANSTRPLTASDGVGGFTGVTIHSEIGGAGTGVNASMTFAGIDQATAEAHFVYTSGTLPGNVGYLLVQYA